MGMAYSVRQHNIDNGVRKSSKECMLEDTLQEAMPWAVRIDVDLTSMRWTDTRTSTRHIYRTPAICQRAILAFDRGVTVAPFRFRLRGDGETFPAGWKAQRSPGANRKGKRYRTTGKTRFVATKHREFGLRQFVEVPA